MILLAAASGPIAPRAPQPKLGGVAYDPSRGPGFGSQSEKVRDKIEDGRESGQLSRREARQLRREARQIRRLSVRYAHGGWSEGERRELQARIDYLNGMVSAKRSGGGGKSGR
jgi:hypothetical protein